MDVDLQPLPAITYTTIGGIIDLYLFTGPTFHDVIQQYWDVIGKPMMPTFWSLGFHLSRWGYNTIDNLRERMRNADFPYDAQWTDIDVMSSTLDYTYSQTNFKGLPDLVRELQSEGKHYVNLIDPAISSTQPTGSYPPYDDGVKQGIFMTKFNSTELIIGQVWPGNTAFPDFTNPKTTEWWTNCAARFHDIIPFDGMLIDMNEPSSFIDGSMDGCTNNNLDNPPFVPTILSFNMFGITHVGAVICGFNLNATEELCTRWMQLGSFYPFMINHNSIDAKDQDPAVFSWTAQQIMKQALLMRYSLIPFWYTLHHQAAMASKTIVQPLVSE
ncbi:unnamed protein product [Rotaria sp. Silwood1]|nr:unnamed protein product [Rotaria sp. Silwood1]